MAQENLNEVRVFAPATVANVACGYDVLGFAIEAPGDEIVARHSPDPGLRIVEITGDNGKLPTGVSENTAGVAAQDLLRHLGMLDRGVELEIHKKMSHLELHKTFWYPSPPVAFRGRSGDCH